MAALGMPPGTYRLGDFDVHVTATDARLASGSLAGSIMQLDHAVANLVQIAGCSAEEAIATVTSTPARLLGLQRERGGLQAGMIADLVLLTPALEVVATIAAGRVVYRRSQTDPQC
jgi:N-acetylglucosamine-6-phosphate deacetylase